MFEQKVDKEAEKRIHALGLGGQFHDKYGERAGTRTERAGNTEKDTYTQREIRSTMGEPSRR